MEDNRESGGCRTLKISFEPSELDRFREVIAKQFGLRFEDSKLDELADVLSVRMEAASRGDVETYLSHLASSQEELRAVAGYLTVPETYFFRTLDHFRALSEVVLPERLGKNSHRLRILSAGCASGEEAYSVAMLLHDRADLRANGVMIRGVDVNPAVIAKARQGRYSEWSMRETPAETRDRHFRKIGLQFQLNDPIRQMVLFEEGNLMDPAGTFWQRESNDVVFLRNVLMYFSPEAAKEVIGRVTESLAPGGYLFMGPAETLRGISQEFHLCHTHDTFYYRRRRKGDAPAQSAGRWFMAAATQPTPTPVAAPEIQSDWLETIRIASERIENLARGRKTPAAKPKPPHAPARHANVSAAMELLREERFAEALDELPSESTASADVQLLRAVVLTNAGKLAEAEAACKLLLKADELNAGAHYVMALCREHADDRRAAGEHDQIALYLDPSFAMPHLHQGLLARRSKDFVTARKSLHQAALLLEREDASRILLFGGGFGREALIELCRRELKACGGTE